MDKLILLILMVLLSSFGQSHAQRVIEFAGMEWTVKKCFQGPGPNYWSDSSKSVWVDSKGFLHLKIRKIKNVWHCAEISSNTEVGYGEYQFFLASKVDDYAPNVVVGLFIYENDSSEIDIEFPVHDSGQTYGLYTVQPYPYTADNQDRFGIELNGSFSTHKFIWHPDKVVFESYHGHFENLVSENHIINQWTYEGNRIPKEGKARLHINFWLMGGNAPVEGKDAELIIHRVDFHPVQKPSSIEL
ncbi:glycoside hydrolase family 16 protein [Mangrovibacterium sp.]|uniref:glycoside hydrolase family 16 protein n=1 Tax=Mangrovibacterium sp. TaxID=1961364 RepID=UPI003563AF9C